MKRSWGVALVALSVGCAAGLAAHQLVEFPARAATGQQTFDYKIVDLSDLIDTVKTKNPQFAKADRREAAEEGMRGFGRAGWRYVGCHQSSTYGWGTSNCNVLLFERASGGASPPSAATATPPPLEEESGHH
jgi:hypothetical protein